MEIEGATVSDGTGYESNAYPDCVTAIVEKLVLTASPLISDELLLCCLRDIFNSDCEWNSGKCKWVSGRFGKHNGLSCASMSKGSVLSQKLL